MIQDIAPSRYFNEYRNVPPEDGDTVFIFRGRQVLTAGQDTARFPLAGELRGIMTEKEQIRYLFRIDDINYYTYLTEPEEETDAAVSSSGFAFADLMGIRARMDLVSMFACMTAFHLFTWYDKNRFCGRCGQPLRHAENERMLKCPECGNMVFPVIAPAVIVGVTDGDRLLMTKYAGRPYTGWALIAGFCEIGETAEDTVRREVMEEAGVHVKNVRYVDSQPWGSDSNLLLGFFCDADGDREIHMDRQELSRAVWVDRAEVPQMKDNHSLTGYMIELFRTGKERSEQDRRVDRDRREADQGR